LTAHRARLALIFQKLVRVGSFTYFVRNYLSVTAVLAVLNGFGRKFNDAQCFKGCLSAVNFIIAAVEFRSAVRDACQRQQRPGGAACSDARAFPCRP
jgi:hypothetical protein